MTPRLLKFVPATGYPGCDWETCMTMNDTWGYKSYDQDWKSSAYAHPQPGGHRQQGRELPAQRWTHFRGPHPGPIRRTPKGNGQWMRGNGEAIYGTTADPFPRLSWGRCTKKLPLAERPYTCTCSTGRRTAAPRPRPQKHRAARVSADQPSKEAARHAKSPEGLTLPVLPPRPTLFRPRLFCR